jgi:hypothetical protein
LKALLEVISHHLHHTLSFGLDLLNAVKTLPFELQLQLQE